MLITSVDGTVIDANRKACELLQGNLASLTSSQTLDLFGSGGTRAVVTSEHRTRTCVLFSCSAWSAWTTRDTSTVVLPPLLTGASSSVIDQLGGLLGSTLTNYTAVQYDAATVANSAVLMAQGAGPVVGTYRKVAPVH